MRSAALTVGVRQGRQGESLSHCNRSEAGSHERALWEEFGLGTEQGTNHQEEEPTEEAEGHQHQQLSATTFAGKQGFPALTQEGFSEHHRGPSDCDCNPPFRRKEPQSW
jgi:hypothetical protein